MLSCCQVTSSHVGSNGKSFLTAPRKERGEEEGEEDDEYVKVFRAVRLQHVLNDKLSVATIEADKIIPKSMVAVFCASITMSCNL